MNEREIFQVALEKSSPEERAAYLAAACAADDALRKRVELLLRSHDDAGSFLEHSPLEFDETIVTDSAATDPDEFDATLMETPRDSLIDFLAPPAEPDGLGRLGQYEVLEVIGRGGMGVVLKAQDTKLNRIVAIKALLPELAANAMASRRFLREAQAAAAVSHDHVVRIYAVHDSGRLPYLVMECIDGRSLQQKIDQTGALDLKEILRIGRQIAAGLSAAHQQGLVHRDIKPANILLENGIERVKITDFGLARAVDDVGITQTGQIAGTPQYMSPEQAEGKSVDHRSDLFSLGSVLYAMCTGRSAFRAESTVAVLKRICDHTPKPIRQINPDIPEWLCEIVERLLEKDLADRFQSADEVGDLLSQHLAHVQQPEHNPQPPRLGPAASPQRQSAAAPPARSRRRWPVAAAVLLVLLVGISLTEATGVTALVPTVIRIVSGEGTLIVEVDDPDVSVQIDGEELIITGAGPKEIRLKPGEYNIQAIKDGRQVDSQLVLITRGGKQIVRVRLEGDQSGKVPLTERPRGGADHSAELRMQHKLTGAERRITHVAFSPDSGTVVGSVGGTFYLWNAVNGKLMRTVKTFPEQSAVRNFAYLPDGRHIAAVGDNHSVCFWDMTLGKLTRQFSGFDADTYALAVAANSNLLATGSELGVRLYDLESGDEVTSYGEKYCRGAAFSPDGQTLAFGSLDAAVLMNVGERPPAELRRLATQNTGSVQALAFSPDGAQLVVGYARGGVVLWDWKEQRMLHSAELSAPVRSVAFLPDGRHYVAGCEDKTIRLWETATGREVLRVEAEHHVTHWLAVSPDGKSLASGGGQFAVDVDKHEYQTDGDFDVYLWRLPESVWPKPPAEEITLVRTFEPAGSWIKRVRFLPDGKRVAALSNNHVLRIHDVVSGKKIEQFRVMEGPRGLALLGNGEQAIMTGDDPSTVELWSLKNPERLQSYDEITRAHCVAVAPGERLFAVAGDPPELWQLNPPKRLQQLQGHERPTYDVAFSPDGSRLATGGSDGRLIVWNAATGDELMRFPGPSECRAVVFTRDGNRLLSGHARGEFCLWDLTTKKLILQMPGHTERVRSIVVLRTGDHALTGSDDGSMRLWDLSAGTETAQVKTGKRDASFIDVSPDGRYCISGGGAYWDHIDNVLKGDGDYALRLWQLPQSVWPREAKDEIALVRKLVGHSGAGGGQPISLSRDGKLLATCGADGTRIWSLPDGKLFAYLPSQTESSLTNVALAPDGQLVATSSFMDSTIYLSNPHTAQLVATLKTELTNIVRLEFSPDGKWLAVAGPNLVSIWDVEVRKIVTSHRNQEYFNAICFTPDGTSLVLGRDRTIWDITTGKTSNPFGLGGDDYGVTVSADGKYYAGAHIGTRHIFVRNFADGKQLARLTGHQDVVTSVRFLPGDRYLASGSHDGSIRVWDWHAEKEIARREELKHLANHVLPLPDGRSAVSFGAWYTRELSDKNTSDWGVRLWQLPASVWPRVNADQDGISLSRTFEGHNSPVRVVAFDAAGKRALSVQDRGGEMLRVWDVESGKVTAVFGRAGLQYAHSAALTPDGKMAATGHYDGTICVWNVEDQKLIRSDHAHTANIYHLFFTPEGREIFSTSIDGTVRIADAATGEEKQRIEYGDRIRAAVMLPDGTHILVGTYEARLSLLNADSGEVVREFQGHRDLVMSVGVSPDGAHAVSASRSGDIYLWDVATGELLRTLRGHTNTPHVCFTPDGRSLVSGSVDRSLRVWDVATGTQLASRTVETHSTNRIAVSPNGRTVLAGGGETWNEAEGVPVGDGDYALRLWQLPESVWPQVNHADENHGINEERVQSLISAAAGIPIDDWTKLVSGTVAPTPDSLESKTLSLMLFSLRALPPAGIEDELPAIANLKKDFQYLTEQTPKPADIAKAMSISREKGYASYIQPEYVTDVTVEVTGDTAHGEVAFEKENLYRGRVKFVARRHHGDWRIEEFHLSNVGLSLVLSENGRWERLQRSAN